MLRLCEIDLKKDLKLVRKILLGRKKYISNSKQDFEGQLLENKMATLKETFGLWVCEGLQLYFTSVLTEDEQIPFQITKMDFKIVLKITIQLYKCFYGGH